MVLKAQIGGYDIGKVFMDAGSGIHLIYRGQEGTVWGRLKAS
jgi:hypothetical protein